MTGDGRWTCARHILCVRLDSMGDLLMTTPAIAALRGKGRHITVLTSPSGAAAARLVPEIDDILIHEAPWMKSPPPRDDEAIAGPAQTATHESASRDRRDDEAMIRRLEAAHFDAAAIFTVATQSPLPAALLCHYAGIPLRLAHCRENPYRLLTTWVPEPEPLLATRHEVQRQLDLVAAVGATTDDERLRLRVPQTARDRVSRLLEHHAIPSNRWVLLHPGASAASRRYPPELFAEAATAIVERTSRTLVLCGSPDEIPLVEDIRAHMRAPSLSFAGALDFPDLCALIEAAPLLVCNNSGPAHIAAAVGTRVVDLYALTNLQHTPWRVPSRVLSHDVPCRNCLKSVCPQGHHACLRGVPPDRVAAAAIDLLRGRSPRILA